MGLPQLSFRDGFSMAERSFRCEPSSGDHPQPRPVHAAFPGPQTPIAGLGARQRPGRCVAQGIPQAWLGNRL